MLSFYLVLLATKISGAHGFIQSRGVCTRVPLDIVAKTPASCRVPHRRAICRTVTRWRMPSVTLAEPIARRNLEAAHTRRIHRSAAGRDRSPRPRVSIAAARAAIAGRDATTDPRRPPRAARRPASNLAAAHLRRRARDRAQNARRGHGSTPRAVGRTRFELDAPVAIDAGDRRLLWRHGAAARREAKPLKLITKLDAPNC